MAYRVQCHGKKNIWARVLFDIHGGGQDLIFPHRHEIAQKQMWIRWGFCKILDHNGFIQIDGEKMSKSLGNFMLLRELLKKFDGDVIAYVYTITHYKAD